MLKLSGALILFFIGSINAGYVQKPVKNIQSVEIASIDECEGKDAQNYTFLQYYEDPPGCNSEYIPGPDKLISCDGNGKSTVNLLQILSIMNVNIGAYFDLNMLYLGISGDLEGKYVFLHESALVDKYLKKCSGVLGRSYVPFRYLEILIADKLDLNVFIAPEGGYQAFKKIASTKCRISQGSKAVDI